MNDNTQNTLRQEATQTNNSQEESRTQNHSTPEATQGATPSTEEQPNPTASAPARQEQFQSQQLQRRGERERGLATATSQHPFTQMQAMMSDMDRLSEAFGFPSMRRLGFPSFFDLAPRSFAEQSGERPTLWSPQVEVFERDGQIVIHADLPGVSKEDVRIEVQDDVLTLRGERKSQHETRNQGVYRSERSYGSFVRNFRLPDGVRPDGLEARFENGVLEIAIPRPEPQSPQPHRVEIK